MRKSPKAREARKKSIETEYDISQGAMALLLGDSDNPVAQILPSSAKGYVTEVQGRSIGDKEDKRANKVLEI